jgi:PilZ domain-containing protein
MAGKGDKKRRYLSVSLMAPARILVANEIECPAKVIKISAGAMSFYSEGAMSLGDHVVVYLEGIDRFEGVISRSIGRVFAINLSLSHARREKLVETLTLEKAIAEGLVKRKEINNDRRTAVRCKNLTHQSVCMLEDDLEMTCMVVDISLTGVSVEMDGALLNIGDIVQIGRMECKVARKTQKGYAFEIIGHSDPYHHQPLPKTKAPENQDPEVIAAERRKRLLQSLTGQDIQTVLAS